ncbi:MAG: type I glutamate--ammonia ligase [Sphingobacteriia bacterium]|nr:type I glutamate--ammonia ligase [Sphingobacteriia bacterium]
MNSLERIKKIVNENGIELIELRFSNLIGKWHNFTFSKDFLIEILEEGVTFDGSSIPGWKNINNSDMIMKPDLETAFIDPFTSHPTLILICDIYEPEKKEGYERDPRIIAKKAENYLRNTGIADTAYFGPEPEFFIFDDVRFDVKQYNSFFSVNSEELPINSGTVNTRGNSGYRCQPKSGYLLSSPNDIYSELRTEMMSQLKSVGITPNLHHHEVSPSQSEIGFKFGTILEAADNVQKLKYVVHNVANSYGKSVTFMPKPIYGENGSGMHVHQSLWLKDKPLFDGKEYANLSKMALYYMGGIIKHGKALNAFTNPSTNSYKRLVPGYEAPVSLVYSACNRSAAIRIPYTSSAKARRIETRFPDPMSNPYLCFAAMLMAGIDGIINKIEPGEAVEQNLYEMSKEKLKRIPSLAKSLDDALVSLEKDTAFLTKNEVFSEGFIANYIKLKKQEVEKINMLPHPAEFEMYY